MQTTTFYAYKGGTGRTLTLANAAKYLSRLGQSVLAVDLDLEAPGLHHKLRLGGRALSPPPGPGVVDYISYYTEHAAFPDSLAPYVMEVPREEERDGPIRMMPAGNILDPCYWQRLARINWHQFLFSEELEGLQFFVELKERIHLEYRPDFLLLDARTGITEVGGVATTILPDQVVCFLLNNDENLEGTRAVLRGIERASKDRPTPIRVVPVLSRVPSFARRRGGADAEAKVLAEIRAFLCEPVPNYPAPLDLPALHVLHAEETLAFKEALRIGSNRAVDESPLLRDYLRLFSQIIPSQAVTPHLDRLVNGALADLLEKPERAQSDLEALATYCPHPTSYMALLKFYRLRTASPKLITQTAVRYWEFSRDSEHPVLRQVIQESFHPDRIKGYEDIPLLSDFVEAVWLASPDRDPALGLKVASHLFSGSNPERGVQIVRAILDSPALEPSMVAECVNLLVQGDQFDLATAVTDQWASRLAESPDFQAAWASAVVRKADPVAAKALFESKHFRPAIVMMKSINTYARLLMYSGKREELDAALARQLDQVLAKDEFDGIVNVARLYDEAGITDAFRARVRETLPKGKAERILSLVDSMPSRTRTIAGTRTVFA